MFIRAIPSETANSTARQGEDNLADVGTPFQKSMSFRRRGERKGCVNDRSHAATFQERPHFTADRARDGALLFDAPGAESGTGDRNSSLHHREQVDLGMGAF